MESGVSGRARLLPRTLAHVLVVLHSTLPAGHETAQPFLKDTSVVSQSTRPPPDEWRPFHAPALPSRAARGRSHHERLRGYEGGAIEGKVLNGATWLMSHS